MGIIDTHAHLQDDAFSRDLDAVLSRAWGAGVDAIVVPGMEAADWERVLGIAESEPRVYAAIGCHPDGAKDFGRGALARLAELIKHPKVVAVGEIGLDYHHERSPRSSQRKCFLMQLELAGLFRTPVIVHCRKADEDMRSLLGDWARDLGGALPDGRPLGVMHHFAGDIEDAAAYVEMGFVISVDTSVTYEKNDRLKRVAAELPLESMIVETDCPYNAPGDRSRRNESALLRQGAAAIASLRGVEFDEVALGTSATARRLFALPDRGAE